MGKVLSDVEVKQTVDSKGNVKERRISKHEVTIENGEPSYIKLYTKMWMEFYVFQMHTRNCSLHLQ